MVGFLILACSRWTWCLPSKLPPPQLRSRGPQRSELLSSELGPKPQLARANLCTSTLICSSPGQDWIVFKQTWVGLEWTSAEFLCRHDTKASQISNEPGLIFIALVNHRHFFSLHLPILFFFPFNFVFILNFDTESNTLSAKRNVSQSSLISASSSEIEVK